MNSKLATMLFIEMVPIIPAVNIPIFTVLMTFWNQTMKFMSQQFSYCVTVKEGSVNMEFECSGMESASGYSLALHNI